MKYPFGYLDSYTNPSKTCFDPRPPPSALCPAPLRHFPTPHTSYPISLLTFNFLLIYATHRESVRPVEAARAGTAAIEDQAV